MISGPAAAHGAGPAEKVALYLEVTLNEQPTGQIIEFSQAPDGSLHVAPSELTELGVVVGSDEAGADGLLDLGKLPGVTFRYDASAQAIDISASVERLVAHHYDAGTRPKSPTDGPEDDARGGVMNYTLYGTTGIAGDDTQAGVSGLFDGWLYGRGGIFAQSFLLRSNPDQGDPALRLNSTWTASDPRSLMTYRAGDLISGGLAWTRPIRMGGIQIQRNFGLRPDVVTAPLPSFSGSAALPSTVDIYANNRRLFSGEVPAGPFTISGLPVVSGAGIARVVVEDSLGRTTESNLPFFASSALLRGGLTDFSLEAGFPRRSFGVESADYSPMPAASATLRHGISDSLTAEAHGEATLGLLNGGAGFVMPVADRGLVDAAVGGSYGDHTGLQANIGVEWHFRHATLRLRTMRAFGDYADVGAVSAVGGYQSAALQALDQVSVSLPLPSRRASLAAAYARTVTGGTVGGVATLSYNRRVGEATSLNVTGYYSPTDSGSGFFVGLTRSLGGGMSTTANVAARDGPARAHVELAKAEGWRPGSIGWRVAGGLGEGADWLASGSLRGTAAHFYGALRGTQSTIAASGEVSGAVVMASGDLFLANHIEDAFAVVDAGAPDVTVFTENRPAGQTDKRGKLLVTGLRSWQPNKLSIDANDLPPADTADKTTASVAPRERTGVLVDFGVHGTHDAALVTIRRPDGAFPPAGTAGTLNDGSAFVVGYDGQAYLEDLRADNRFELSLADGQSCRGTFQYAPDRSVQAVVDGVVCQ